MRPPITAIVLAAGLSRRFGGGNKLLHLLEGEAVLAHTLRAVLAGEFAETLVVTGHERALVEALLPAGCRAVPNPRYAEGMSTSLVAGVHAAKAGTAGYLIVPGDMPFLTSATLIALADGASTSRLAACRGADGPVAPAFLGHEYRRELEALTGDHGARTVLMAHHDQVRLIAVPEGELVDVDTPSPTSS